VAGPGLVVSGENLKVQIARLRKALGAHRNLIGTEFGSGYRFIGVLRSNATAHAADAPGEQSGGFLVLCFGGTADIAPGWFQFELGAETSTNAHVGYFGAPGRSPELN
jgi:hypothetical protein